MDVHEKILNQWEAERKELYPRLDSLADDLHTFHKESSKYLMAGTTARAVGTVANVYGALSGKRKTEVTGLFCGLLGEATVTATQLVQEYKDCTALREARQLLDKHKDTHNDLKKHLGKMCTLQCLDYRQLHYTPAIVPTLYGASETMQKALSFYKAIYGEDRNKTPDEKSSAIDNATRQSGNGSEGNGAQSSKEVSDKAEIINKTDKIMTVLTAISGIIVRDVPLFFQSWMTMNGERVPETVSRLRYLRNDLERDQDNLMIQFGSVFSSKEFQEVLKKTQAW